MKNPSRDKGRPRGVIRPPIIGRLLPKTKTASRSGWRDSRQHRSLQHFRNDQAKPTVERDQGLVARACARANKNAYELGTMSFIDPSLPNLCQRTAARQREIWSALIYDAASTYDLAYRGGRQSLFWFGMTVVNERHFVNVDQITPHRIDRIKRWHRERFSRVKHGLFEAGHIDISRNQDVDGIVQWSLHVHSLIGVAAGSEEEAKEEIKRAYRIKKAGDRLTKPVMLKRTYPIHPPSDKRAAIGWISYMLRSTRFGLIMRRDSFVKQDGKQGTLDRHLQTAHASELVRALAKIPVRMRLVLAGARISGGRLKLTTPASQRQRDRKKGRRTG